MFGNTLQRMIFWELVRVFLLALVTLTGLFLLGGLVTEATQRGLSPLQVFLVIPLLIPNTLPYTIPATTLFATCVVYGRLAHDNEVTAVKAAGVHLGRLISPSILLGLLTAGGTLALYYDFIPRTHHMLRNQVVGNAEELLYGVLKRYGSFVDRRGYAMWVRQVQGRLLLDVIFKQRDGQGGYKFVARAREARIHYITERNVIRVDMSYVSTISENGVSVYFSEETQEIPVPTDMLTSNYQKRPTDMVWEELLKRRHDVVDELRQVTDNAANPPIPEGTSPDDEVQMRATFSNRVPIKQREQNTIDVEVFMRPALAVGCLCFALIGGPVGIWFSRADYLSAFVSCFLPTVFIYYPLLLCGTNLAKDGRIPAAIGLWAANAAIGCAALVLYWKVLRR